MTKTTMQTKLPKSGFLIFFFAGSGGTDATDFSFSSYLIMKEGSWAQALTGKIADLVQFPSPKKPFKNQHKPVAWVS